MGVFIIAEAGVNHNGDINIAKKLIDCATEANCDAIKFQCFTAKTLVTQQSPMAEYQIKNIGIEKSQYQMLKELELNESEYKELMKYCNEKGIIFLSSPFDLRAVDILSSFNISKFKVASGEITNKPLLKYIARQKKPIILSTGMATLGEVEEALTWIYEENNLDVTLLHCTSNYPTEVQDVNLMAMLTMREAFKVPVGYSDHTIGTQIPIAAVALGAQVIEKHFTLDKNMLGPDHKASLEPDELKEMVSSIRMVEKAKGDGIKKPCNKEIKAKEMIRKSIVANQNIKQGEVVSIDKLSIKRPGTGSPPSQLEYFIGKKAKREINEDEVLQIDDVTSC